VLVIGAGKMSGLAARHLRASGAAGILVTNRSPERAAELAREVEGTARRWEDLEALLAEADVVLTSTGAREPILTPRLVKRAMKARRWRPVVVVDIAVPRDADPAIGRIDGVYLFDIDDLERVVAENLVERQRSAEAAQAIIDLEVAEHRRWLRAQRVVPTIRSLRDHFHQVAAAEAERCVRGLARAGTPEETEKAIRRMSELIANKLLHSPMSALRGGDQGDLEILVEVTERLFALRAGSLDSHPGPGPGPGSASEVGSEAESGSGSGSEPDSGSPSGSTSGSAAGVG
jgi:glutamyl-tRNA reductase